MKTTLTTEIDVDELMSGGLFQSEGGTLISLGGSLRFKASKSENLAKFAAALNAAAINLAVALKTGEAKKQETT